MLYNIYLENKLNYTAEVFISDSDFYIYFFTCFDVKIQTTVDYFENKKNAYNYLHRQFCHGQFVC